MAGKTCLDYFQISQKYFHQRYLHTRPIPLMYQLVAFSTADDRLRLPITCLKNEVRDNCGSRMLCECQLQHIL